MIIDPKMAFGTGHHATTWMMIDRMRTIDFNRKKVLDFGAGTAILAILAHKLNADHVDAIEIEPPAVENAIQNIELNDAHNIQVILGDINSIPEETYDVILANINRNVILESLPRLYSLLQMDGKILVSGILDIDKSIIMAAFEKHGFVSMQIHKREDWLCFEVWKRDNMNDFSPKKESF